MARDPRAAWAIATTIIAAATTAVSYAIMAPGDAAGLALTIALGAIALALLGFVGYGALRSCPRCRRWFQAESTGSLSAHKRRQSETWYYRCKTCQHRWRVHGAPTP